MMTGQQLLDFSLWLNATARKIARGEDPDAVPARLAGLWDRVSQEEKRPWTK